jgi:ElaB/YqjD/DUF883 family membrane-anchored ribosome-binding protein
MDTNNITEKASETVKAWQDTASDLKDMAKERASDLTARAKGAARDTGAAADLYLHEYAWSTVIGVAVAACLLGYMLGRRD